MGIADDDMPKVFSLFRRAGNDGIPGTGAGLPYCRTLVERHGGEIWCESTDGEGTTFHFSLPEMEADGGDYVAQ